VFAFFRTIWYRANG
jgi:hypothetical protein